MPGDPDRLRRAAHGGGARADPGEAARAEAFLLERGFRQVRVRVHGRLARIEVAPDAIKKLLELREETAACFRALGFTHVCVDLEGYRAGSMNETLPPEMLARGHSSTN